MSIDTRHAPTGAGMGEDLIAEARRELDASLQMIRHCVGQLDDDQVWWRPQPDMNSIGNLLLHLSGNLKQRLLALIGGEPDDRNRLAEFTERGPIPKRELMSRFEDVVGRVDGLLASLPPARLHELRGFATFAGTQEITVQGVIFRTLTHLAGHSQEIITMTRAQLGERYVFRNPAGVPPRAR